MFLYIKIIYYIIYNIQQYNFNLLLKSLFVFNFKFLSRIITI
jgi:hypothetical protein